MTSRLAVALAALGLLATDAGADKLDDRPFFDRMWHSIEAQLDLAISENRRKPPQPVVVTWKKKRLGAVDLGAPVLDLVSRDLDGDGKAELIALTTTHVVVLRKSGHRKVKEVTRIALPAKPAPIRTRAPVGVLVVTEDGQIRARSSDQAEGVVLRFDGDKLVVDSSLAGWPLCSDGLAQLVAGQAVFDQDSVVWPNDASYRSIDKNFLMVSCGSGLVDPIGNSLDLFGFVGVDDSLVVRCHSDNGTCVERETVYKKVGYAFELADIDNDGHPEVITTSNRPFDGLVDRVTVHGRGGKMYSKKFGGGVVAVTAGDVDGNGAREVVAVVRLAGSTRVNLWTLN